MGRRYDPAPEKFTAKAFIIAAQRDELSDLLADYLSTEPWANTGLRDGLARAPRWWQGPIRARLDDLVPVHGPGLEYPADPTRWGERISCYARSLTAPDAVPPLIVEWSDGILKVRDGSHRLAAMRSINWSWCWTIIWSNNAQDDRALAGNDALMTPARFG
ncbi:MAG: hypothetical protein AAF390_02805 [Pseudomonadota bacterium]